MKVNIYRVGRSSDPVDIVDNVKEKMQAKVDNVKAKMQVKVDIIVDKVEEEEAFEEAEEEDAEEEDTEQEDTEEVEEEDAEEDEEEETEEDEWKDACEGNEVEYDELLWVKEDVESAPVMVEIAYNTDTINDALLKIQNTVNIPSNSIRIIIRGKRIREGYHRVAELTENRSTVLIAGRLCGGAKRGRAGGGGLEDGNKDDKIRETSLMIAPNILVLQTPLFNIYDGDVILNRIGMAVSSSRNNDVVRLMMNDMSVSILKKLNDSLASTNNADARTMSMTKALFEDDLCALQNQEEAVNNFTETLHLSVKIGFLSAYFDGVFDWKKQRPPRRHCIQGSGRGACSRLRCNGIVVPGVTLLSSSRQRRARRFNSTSFYSLRVLLLSH
jgi:hypothetical protein